MSKLEVRQCSLCKRTQIKIGEGKWSSTSSVKLELLREQYDVDLIYFICSECESRPVYPIHFVEKR